LGKGKKIGLGIGIAIIAFFIITISFGSSRISEQKQEIANLSDESLKSMAVDWTCPDLLRNYKDYDGKIIYFRGTVTVPTEANIVGITVSGPKVLQVSDENVIFVEYGKKRFLNNDVVDGFGYGDALRELIVTHPFGGAKITEEVPNLEGIRINCIECR